MAGDRRTARLRVAWAVAATWFAAAAVVAPWRQHAILPGPGDLAVGWSFLAASLLAFRRSQVAVCLGVGGGLWVLVGLAPDGPVALEEPMTRLGLAPTALLVCAAAGLSTGRGRRWVVVPGAIALAMAAIGGAGAPRAALVGIAVAGLAVPIAAAGQPAATRLVQAGAGAGLFAVALAEAGAVTLPADMSVAFHLFVLASGAVAVGWCASAGVRLGAGLRPEGPSELGRALGRALGTGEVTVLFPRAAGGWLDPAGRPGDPKAAAYDVTDTTGRVLARTTPALLVERSLAPDLHRFLSAAGDGARLRAVLRERAEELARSRTRLESAAEDERRRLVSRLEVGPLRRLDRLARELGSGADGAAWTVRTALARRTLDDLVSGLDPVANGGGLLPALSRLADAAGAPMTVSGPVPDDLDAGRARVLWFACAEALANVRKHAPGAAITVGLEATDDIVLVVSDDGPGGADPAGAGLLGLTDRLALVGGSLDLTTGSTGTTVVARVPAGNDVLPLIPGTAELATVDP